MVIIHNSGTIITEQMNNAVTYQAVVPTRRGFLAGFALAVVWAKAASVGSVVTVGPE
jgi:hypothetical protein